MAKFLALSLALIFTLYSSGAETQFSTTSNSFGLIVLSKAYGEKNFIHLYNEDGTLWHKFSFYYDDSGGNFEYANQDFRPFAFHPDYFLLALKCVRKEPGRYEVIANENTGLRKYVKADDPSLKFETWADHILKVFSVGFNLQKNPVLEAPRGRAKKGIKPDLFFYPVEVKGEWLKVKWDAETEVGKQERARSGWVRWKRGERLLVELFYFA